MSDNLKAVEQALRAMPDVIARHTIDKTWGPHRVTGKGRVLQDAKIIVWPTAQFCAEQLTTNLHVNTLDNAVVTPDGTVVTEPSRQDFPSFIDYQDARKAFETGRKIRPQG